MHILVTADTIGGVWTYTRELVTGLASRGIRITLVSFGGIPPRAQRAWLEGLAGVTYFPTGYGLEWMQDAGEDVSDSTRYLRNLIDERKPDLLHLSQYCFGSLGVALLRGDRSSQEQTPRPGVHDALALEASRHSPGHAQGGRRVAAARGDYTAALRLLVAAVATAVSGRPYWESSPLTVRELFRASGRLDQLRQLLLPFELSVYGFRPVDEATYRRAAQLAEPFRAPLATAEEAA